MATPVHKFRIGGKQKQQMSEQRFKPRARDECATVTNVSPTESSLARLDDFKPVAILDEEKVHAVTSLSKTTRWRMERRGEFPKRVRLSPGRIGWRLADIEAWISSRAA